MVDNDTEQDTALEGELAEAEEPAGAEGPVAEPELRLGDLSPRSRNRVRRFIIYSVLSGGATGEAVAGLYADLADDPRATRYLDSRFLLRRVPPEWRQFEDEVLDLTEAAHQRGLDLAATWRRVQEIAKDQPDEDPMDALARLAGAEINRRPVRSIFDDPEDLDSYDDEEDNESRAYAPFAPGHVPSLYDLAPPSQERIRLYIIEERLEHGLPPAELMELYRYLDTEGDERARQYLDRVFVEGDVPLEWQGIQLQADEVAELAARRGKEAGRLFAEARRRSSALSALELLQLLRDELT